MSASNRFTSWKFYVFVIAAVAVAAGTLLHLSYYFPRTIDDLFISLRYADQLISGHGLTYNTGQYVEGFSNPTWVLAQSVLMFIGVEGVLATKLLGLASLAALQVATYLFARRVFDAPRGIALLPPILVGASGYLLSWSTWGLETPLFLCLLILLPLVLRWCAENHGWRIWSATAAFVVLFAFTRPEAGLYVLAVGLAVLFGGGVSERLGLETRFQRLFSAGAISAVAVGIVFVLRKAYFGLWLPHTYYAKQGSGFSLTKLTSLIGEGASAFEVLFLCGGLVLLVARLVYERRAALLCIGVACMLFVASVTVDWMPNQRHFLPIHLVSILAWTWAASQAWAHREHAARAPIVATVVAVICTGAAFETAGLDVRYSPSDFQTHGDGKRWVRPKTTQKLRHSLRSLSGAIPAPAYQKFRHHPGMIGQLYYLIESSARPEKESWYVGRDIGRLGYYSPVQVFDTPGLFTPEAIHAGKTVSKELKLKAFDRDVVAAELLNGWWPPPRAVRRRYEMSGRRMRPEEVVSPSRQQLVRRYKRIADAFPTAFTMETLYGESVGGIVELRANHVEKVLGNPLAMSPTAEWSGEPPRASLEQGKIEFIDCQTDKSWVSATNPTYMTCYWKKNRPVSGNFRVFAHVENTDGAGRFLADHGFAGGMYPIGEWPDETVIRDTFALVPSADTPKGQYAVWLGLWDDAGRASVSASHDADDANRILAGTVEVRK